MGKRINNIPIAGGNWSNSTTAGAFARNLNNYSTNSNNNVGAADSGPNLKSFTGILDHRDALSSDKRTRADSVNFSSLIVENLNQSPKQPKRVGYLYERTFTKESLYEAYLIARKGKRKKPACFEFELSIGAEIDALYEELSNGTYKPMPLHKFEVFEPKRRTIHAPHFRDLVVQHAIYKVIYPIFDSGFIDQSYACRKGGGTHKASDYTQAAMRTCDGELYYAKLDVRKFFYRIDRAILRKQFERKIKDKRFIDVMCAFVTTNEEIGIPIGNLLSQIYALVCLNDLDHFVKRELKIKKYVRYVDDFIAIGLTLEEAKDFKAKCEQFLKDNLNLELSHWTISKVRKGINFVGYRTWRSVKFVRRHSVAKFKKAVKRGDFNPVISLIGHAQHSATIVFYSHFLHKNNLLSNLPPRSKALCLSIINTHPLRTSTQH